MRRGGPDGRIDPFYRIWGLPVWDGRNGKDGPEADGFDRLMDSAEGMTCLKTPIKPRTWLWLLWPGFSNAGLEP